MYSFITEYIIAEGVQTPYCQLHHIEVLKIVRSGTVIPHLDHTIPQTCTRIYRRHHPPILGPNTQINLIGHVNERNRVSRVLSELLVSLHVLIQLATITVQELIIQNKFIVVGGVIVHCYVCIMGIQDYCLGISCIRIQYKVDKFHTIQTYQLSLLNYFVFLDVLPIFFICTYYLFIFFLVFGMPRSVRIWRVMQQNQSFSREKNQSRKERYSPKKVKRNKQELRIVRPKSNSKTKNQVFPTKEKDKREKTDSQDQNSQPTTSIKNIYQEIETIQRQFSKFRLTIMKQLQRQEIMMRQLIQSSFEKFIYGQLFNAESETQKKKAEDLFNQPLKLESQSKSHIYIPKLNISRTNMNAIYTERTKPQTSKQQSTKNFSRFFEAIKILRKNVEDISDVGETNSVEGRISKSKVENRRLFMKTPKLSYN